MKSLDLKLPIRKHTFLLAAVISVVWHCFWFFSTAVVVSPQKLHIRKYPAIVSIGPVLDDTIFRTLSAAKPQLPETFYRSASDLFSPAVDVEVKRIERFEPGQVVSTSSGTRLWDELKSLVKEEKNSPE